MTQPTSQIDASRGQGQVVGDHGVVTNTFNNTVNNTIVPAAPVMWPVWVGSAPPLADCFQDRAEGDLLAEWTVDSGTVVLTQVLSGLGGVGKSQLAAQLVARRWDAQTVDLLVWVAASTQSAVIAGFAQAAQLIGIADQHEGDVGATRLLQWLAATDRRWLIVLDDVNDPADLHNWWPHPTLTGTTVVTTRRRDAAFSGHNRRCIEVGLFTMDEANTYLQAKLAARPDLADDVAGVATDLGRLPLALAQAAAYLLDEEIPCSRYRQLFADRTHQLAALVPEPTSLPDSHQDTVDVTWSMSIQAANRHRPIGLAGPLLHWAALLDPEGIPERVLTALATLKYLTFGRGGNEPVTADMVRQAVRCLHRFNLISHDSSNPARAVRVHALVQRSTREHTPISTLDRAAQAAAAALYDTWPGIELDPQLGQALRANTNALYAARPDALWNERGGHQVLFRAGDNVGEIGHVAAAANYFRDLYQVATQRLGADHPHTLNARRNLARWQGQAGDPAGAAAAFAEQLPDFLRVLGPDHAETLATRSNLARSWGQAGDPARAAAACALLLDDYLRVVGRDHPDSLATRHQLAFWQGEAGDPGAAAAAFAVLLDDYQRVLGPGHTETLATRGNLARSWGQAGDPARAAAAFAVLLDDCLGVLGPDHPNTLTARHHLAYWRGQAGDPAAAVDALLALLDDRVRVLGPDHPHTLATRHNLIQLRGEAGDPVAAVDALLALLDDRVRVLGPDHPHTLATRHHLAGWRGEAGDAAAATAAFADLLDDYLRVLGPDHADTLAARGSLAGWRGEAGDANAAVAAFGELFQDCLRVFGPNHSQTLNTRRNLAHWHQLTTQQAIGDLDYA